MKRLILIITLIGITTDLLAQKWVFAGIKGGANIATINSGVQDDSKYIGRLNFAAFVEYRNWDSFYGFQGALHFVQKGIAYNFKNATPSVDLKVRTITNYIEVPLLFKAVLKSDDKKLGANAVVGPSFGVAINRKNITRVEGKRDTEKIFFDKTGPITDNRFDMGLVFGVGVDYVLDFSLIMLDIRYNLDLNDNINFAGERPNNWDKTTNRSLSITFGVMVPLVIN